MNTRPAYLKHNRLSAYQRETVALVVIAVGSLAGIALCWWLG